MPTKERFLADKCRVCGKEATQKLDGVAFCDRHIERASRQRGGLLQADLVTAASLTLFVVAAWAVERWVQPVFTDAQLLIVGLVMALVPAALWLTFFYRRDRLEPEPRSMVVEVFILGALVAGAVGMPLVERVFDVSSWMYRSPWTHLVGAILVVGITQETLKYLAVRFSVYQSETFNELADGIVYASAVGLGYATALNIGFVLESGGAHLGLTALRVVLTAVAQAAITGVTGYFIARQKLRTTPDSWMATGVSLAALLNGVFFVARGTLTRGALSVEGGLARPWAGLVLTVVLVSALTVALSRAIRRDVTKAAADRAASGQVHGD